MCVGFSIKGLFMKSSKVGLVLILGILLGAFAANAIPLVLNDTSSQYLGSVTKGTPTSPGDEVGYINTLIGMGAGTTSSLGGNTFVRSDKSFGALPVASLLIDWDKDDTNPSNVIDITGWTYLYGKYGSGNDHVGALVWFVGDLTGQVEIPRHKLSHWSVFNPKTSVPDGGMTVMLLGATLLGLGALKRKIR
jgi:hypothetical protein